jgi:hypothetical protein
MNCYPKVCPTSGEQFKLGAVQNKKPPEGGFLLEKKELLMMTYYKSPLMHEEETPRACSTAMVD